MKRLAFDGRFFFGENPTAHSSLFRQRVSQNRIRQLPFRFIIYVDNISWKGDECCAPNVKVRHLEVAIKTSTRLGSVLWENFTLPKALKQDRVDVFLSCFYRVPIFTRVARVNMIHDLAFFTLPPFLNSNRHTGVMRRAALWLAMRSHSALCKRTITVSRFSQICLERILRLSSEITCVVPNAVDDWFYHYQFHAEPSSWKPYIAFVGSCTPKKNLESVLSVYAGLNNAAREEFDLRIRSRLTPELKAMATGLGIDASIIVLEKAMTRDELRMFVAGARCLVLFSYEEGFGLPVAEAQAAGVPVLTSDGGSLPEFSSSVVALGDGFQQRATAALEAILTRSEISTANSRRGREQAKDFRPQVVCEKFIAVINGVS